MLLTLYSRCFILVLEVIMSEAEVNTKQKHVLDPRVYMQFWFKVRNLSARSAMTEPNLFGTIYLDYLNLFKQYRFNNPNFKAQALTEKVLLHAYIEYIDLQRKEDLLNAMNGYECIREDLNPLKTYVKAVTGHERPTDIAVLAHWIWLVKRKARGLECIHQIMPIFYGKQGGGKTMALKRLIAPFVDFQMNMKMNQLADERQFEGFANNFVILFDELQGIERTDVNALKNQITTDFNSYRKLHTHATLSVPQRCSFIGATNRPVAENFSDSTGMRRFWEIITADILDWTAINSIDYKSLWQGIDERLDSGYLTGDILQSVQSEQQALVNADDLDIFIADQGLKYDNDDFKLVSSEDLYNSYVYWAARNGIFNKMNAIWFGRKMVRRLPNEANGRNKRLYKVNTEFELIKEGPKLVKV